MLPGCARDARPRAAGLARLKAISIDFMGIIMVNGK
jgi:hypothetical protein